MIDKLIEIVVFMSLSILFLATVGGVVFGAAVILLLKG